MKEPTQSLYQAFDRQRKETKRCNGNFLGDKSFDDVVNNLIEMCPAFFTKETAEKHVKEKIIEWKNHKDDRLFFYVEYPKGYALDTIDGLSINIKKIWESKLPSLSETHDVFQDTSLTGPSTVRLVLK